VFIQALYGRTKCKDGTISFQPGNNHYSGDTVNMLLVHFCTWAESYTEKRTHIPSSRTISKMMPLKAC